MLKLILGQIRPRINIMLINQISVLLTLPILLSNMSSYSFGLVGTSLIIMQAGWVIIDWASTVYFTEVWHNYKTQIEKNKFISQHIFSRLLIATLYLLIISGAITFHMIILPWEFFILIIPGILAGGMFPLWFFHIIKKPGELVRVTLISRIIFILLTFWLVRSDTDIATYLILQSFTFSLITLFAFRRMFLFHNYLWQPTNLKSVIKHLRLNTPFMVNTFSNNHIHVFWSLSLSILSVPVAIGLYSIAEQGYRAGNSISATFAQVIRVNTIQDRLENTWSIVLTFMLLVFMVFIAGQWIIINILPSFLPDDYKDLTNILKIMLIIWLFQAWIKFINYSIIGKILGIDNLHKFSLWITLLHFICIFIWASNSGDLVNFTEYFLLASILQFLILMCSLIIKYFISK